MTTFSDLLNTPARQLSGELERYSFPVDVESSTRIEALSASLDLNPTQLVVGLGFNPGIAEQDDILGLLGFTSAEALFNRRDYLFSTDIYRKLTISRILDIYSAIKGVPSIIDGIQGIILTRLAHIEENINGTISSRVIDSYRQEIRTIYAEGIGQISFAEHRLGIEESGFRALANEVMLIVESRILPAGDLFFRDSIQPEEKRKMIKKDLIPKDLIITRLTEANISEKERKMLKEFV